MSAVAVTSVLPPSSRALQADHATSPASCLRHARCHRSPLHLRLAQHASCSCPPPRCALGDFTGHVYSSWALAWLHSCRPLLLPSTRRVQQAYPRMHFHTLRLIETHTWSTSPASQNQITRSNGYLDTVPTLGNAHASTPLRGKCPTC